MDTPQYIRSAQKETEHGTQRFDSVRRRVHRLRPKSWLPFSRSAPQETLYPRSFSTQLPKTASTSTVARSVISAPILTSTTNVSVARTEGVHCGEISEAAFSQSTWNSQVGWVATEDSPGLTPRSALSPVAEDKTQVVNGAVLRKGGIIRLKNVIKRRVRSSPSQRPAHQQQTDRRAEEAEATANSSLRRDISRRRAETINLYKGKIKGLTGNGHIRRKSVNPNSPVDSVEERDPPLLGDITDVPLTDLGAGDNVSDHGSPFGSLTKSFASAVDKLDFYSTLPRNMSFLRSRSSFFNLKKGDREDAYSKAANQNFPLISPSKPAPPINQPIAAAVQTRSLAPPTQGRGSNWNPKVPQRGVPTISTARTDAARRRSGPSPMVFSNEKNDYVAAAPAPSYPGGVNPLRMHPPDTMASRPSVPDRSSSAKTPGGGPPPANFEAQGPAASADVDTDSETTSLEDAPIYSPSLGDLSQYARDTPRSAASVSAELRIDQTMNPTPTRSPAKNRIPTKKQGLLKKSRSGISLFSRSKADSNLMGEGRNALHQLDANQKVCNGEKMVKKSKSLHFGTLFKKEAQSDLLPSMPPSPFQPATPSPLRKVMRYGSQSTKGGTSPTTLPIKK